MKTFTPPIGRAGCLLSRIWTSPVPPPSICVSLMHKAVISQMHQPLRKVSLGIMAYLKGIKNVLDRLAASLIPRSRSSHRAVLYARASVKCTHNIFPGSRGHVVHCVPVDVWHCGCFSAHFCFFYTDRAVILKKNHFGVHYPAHLITERLFQNFTVFFDDGNYRQGKCWQFPAVELLICCSLMSRVFNQAKGGGGGKKKKNNTEQYVLSALILLLLLHSCLLLIKGHSVSWPH